MDQKMMEVEQKVEAELTYLQEIYHKEMQPNQCYLVREVEHLLDNIQEIITVILEMQVIY